MKSFSLILLFCLSCALGQANRTPIEGEYLHKYGDNESINQAKAFCKDMALRNAVESQQIFVSSISELKNFELTKDMIRSLSAGYIEDLKIVEERVDKINNEIAPFRARYEELMANPKELEEILQMGADKARRHSRKQLDKTRRAIGIRPLAKLK